ncbi:Caspase recruitment domain-containing protein 8 [Collichthys lucidus]|uniref:Caspase recruitment domain-containing protein 8 n=1 Tax=Collichthys lucidus TaxID=240159 RepID=A0A4U5VGW5_COLLU|nr:Caspase recruitment domain-containing protein 8 [Collichthys lucidus]
MEDEMKGLRDRGKTEASTESEIQILSCRLGIHSGADEFKTFDPVSDETGNMLHTSGVKETFLWPPVYRSPVFPVFFYAGTRRYDRAPFRDDPHHIGAVAVSHDATRRRVDSLARAIQILGDKLREEEERNGSLLSHIIQTLGDKIDRDMDLHLYFLEDKRERSLLARAIKILRDELRMDHIRLDNLEDKRVHDILLMWPSNVSYMLHRSMAIFCSFASFACGYFRNLQIFTSRHESHQNARETNSAEYTLPDHSHPLQHTGCFRSRRDSSCLPRPHSVPSLSPSTSIKSETLTRANSLPDMLLENSFEEFTPDIDEDDESYRFQCSCPGLYQCSVTGLVFHMEGEGDVDYRTVPWNRRRLTQHHKKPAGPLFDIKCVQQSMRQLHLPHCEIRSTGGCDFLSVAHVNDEGIEFITPHKITETHVVINITGFSGFGNVKDEDSPPVPVRALVLLLYRPPACSDFTSYLNVLLLPKNNVLRDVLRTRKKLFGDENPIQTSPQCKLHPEQEYTLSTCPEDDSVLVQPTEAEFDCDNYDNYFPSFQVKLKKIILDIQLFLKHTSSSHIVWEREVCLRSTGVKRSCVQGSSDDSLLDIRSSFIDGISGPVLQSLVDKMFEKKVMTDSERESVDGIQNKRDKARFVFDTVRKKGDAASSEMTDFLCEVDPFLSEHLGLM